MGIVTSLNAPAVLFLGVMMCGLAETAHDDRRFVWAALCGGSVDVVFGNVIGPYFVWCGLVFIVYRILTHKGYFRRKYRIHVPGVVVALVLSGVAGVLVSGLTLGRWMVLTSPMDITIAIFMMVVVYSITIRIIQGAHVSLKYFFRGVDNTRHT